MVRRALGPRRIVASAGGPDHPRFSICTMVTRWAEYEECLASFYAHGFDKSCCEFLTIDNSAGNVANGYVAVNEFLQAASGDYVILCHQDVVLIRSGRADLERALANLDALDPAWGLCGNAGHTDDGWPVICISHPHGEEDIEGGPFPARVVSLDENFILAKRAANLAVSNDLAGFHHYGPDLCIIADILGWHSYVINFFLRHNSGGNFDQSYFRSRLAIINKYRRALRPRWIYSITKHHFHISGSGSLNLLARILRRARLRLHAAPNERDVHDPVKRRRRDARRANALKSRP